MYFTTPKLCPGELVRNCEDRNDVGFSPTQGGGQLPTGPAVKVPSGPEPFRSFLDCRTLLSWVVTLWSGPATKRTPIPTRPIASVVSFTGYPLQGYVRNRNDRSGSRQRLGASPVFSAPGPPAEGRSVPRVVHHDRESATLLSNLSAAMLHVDRILCPFEPTADLDASPAFSQSLHLAEQFGASVHVVPYSRNTGRSESGASASRTGERDGVAAISAATDAMDPGVQIVSPPDDFPVDPSTADLVQYASDHEIDLIIVDTPQDRGPIPPMASDPVRTIVEMADMPVFVAAHADAPSSVRRILVPVDFSEHAREALQHAKFLADSYGASIDVLHVIERPQYVALNPTDMLAFSDATLTERKTRRRIQSFLDETNGVSVPARFHLAHGNAADQIVNFTGEHPIDLVVLSTHGVIGRPQHPLGTVADKVLRRAACPILLTRAFGRSLVSFPSSDGAAADSTPSVDVPRQE